MGKIIDAEFGGRNAHDRYCASCRERYPRSSTLCPRCGGALQLWATHVASAERRAKRNKLASTRAGIGFILALVLAAIMLLVMGSL